MENQMLLIASCAALTVIAGIFVLLPLFGKTGSSLDIELMAETELDRLVERKTALYRNLKDLAFEYEMGRLSNEDFRQLEAGYKTEAAAILQKLEQAGATGNLDDSIEKDITSRKKEGSSRQAGLTGDENRCPSCGADIIPGKNFCADCGHQLK